MLSRILFRFFIDMLAIAALGAGGLAIFSWYTARKVEAAVPPAGHFRDIDGARLHFTEAGASSGPSILLIHGLGGQLLNFPETVIRPLMADYHVIAVDRPGSGYSKRSLTEPANIRAQAARVAKIIEAFGLKAPLVVGHSLGGAIALALALDHPHCVGGLALISPLSHRIAGVPKLFRGLAIRSRVLRLLVAWTVAVPGALRSSRDTLTVIFGPDPVPADFPIRRGGLLALRPSAYFSASSDLAAVDDDLPYMIANYGRVGIPVGVLYGTGDRVLDHEVHGMGLAAKVRGLDLELIEGGGHMAPITAPERTAAFIRRLAERVASRECEGP